MTTKLYLNFPDRATAIAVASGLIGETVETFHADGWWRNPETEENVYWNLDDIGTFTDEEGNPQPGYHINGWWHSDNPLPETLQTFQIFPETPNRVFG